VTNNASRTPLAIGEQLAGMGVPVQPGSVITSAQAAARILSERLPRGSSVLVVGGTGLRLAVRERGLRPVTTARDHPAAVVQGYQRTIDYPLLAEGALAVAAGALFVASNADATLPSTRGPQPGNGALLQVIAVATGRDPIVAGKPEPSMHEEMMLRTGAKRPLIVGDRLDTDIEGANRVDADSLLVLTGVSRPADVVLAPAPRRPSYLAAQLTGLLEPHPLPSGAPGEPLRCNGWQASWAAPGASDGAGAGGARIELTGSGDPIDALRLLCAACWPRDGVTADAIAGALRAADLD
jgi:HAD superfamily hydrolase (TIGR01450 family)